MTELTDDQINNLAASSLPWAECMRVAYCLGWEERGKRDAEVCDAAEREFTAEAKAALAKDNVLLGHRQLVAARLAAEIRGIEREGA